MNIDWFYVRLFLRPSVMFAYFKRWWQYKERPIKETLLVGNRPLTEEEIEYGESLTEEELKHGISEAVFAGELIARGE